MALLKRINFKRIFIICCTGGLVTILFIFIADWRVTNFAGSRTYKNTGDIPVNKVGLLLGTARKLKNGQMNLYYKYRIEAAVKLFRENKIKYILISGDNSTIYYDEPTAMKSDLIERGVPASKIFLDYAGFRTLDSIVRSKEIFGQESITVISQEFHNERAIYIADSKGVQAIGYNAKDVPGYYGFKVMLREKIARVKMILDLWFSVEPKFLGEKIEIKG